MNGHRKESQSTDFKNPTKRRTSTSQRGLPVCEKSEVNVYDIGLYISTVNGLFEQEKYNLIKNIWQPSKDFIFLTLSKVREEKDASN